VDLRDKSLRGVAHVEYKLRRDHEIHACAAVLREPAHETLGPAVGPGPLCGIATGIMVHLLHEALLVLGRQQAEVRRHLQDAAIEPGLAFVALATVSTVPVRQRCRSVYCWPAVDARRLEQCGVMRFGVCEAVRADDLLA